MLVLLLTGCTVDQSTNEDNLDIITSFYPVRSITEYISGDLNNIEMIQSSAGIHSFEPSAQDIARIETADVFIYHSRTLENWTQNLDATTEHAVLVEATEGVSLKRVPGLENFEVPDGVDEKNFYDPHSWLDPILVAEEGQVIADTLSEIDPENETMYQENAERLYQEADALIEKYQPLFEEKENNIFITEHTAFQYLADRFDLEQVGIAGIDDSEEPSPRKLAEITVFIEENNIPVVFQEKNSHGKFAQTIASETGVEIAVLDPLEADPANGETLLENIEMQLQILDQYLK